MTDQIYFYQYGRITDPDQFGIFDMHGMDFVKGNFIHDVAALSKVELLP